MDQIEKVEMTPDIEVTRVTVTTTWHSL